MLCEELTGWELEHRTRREQQHPGRGRQEPPRARGHGAAPQPPPRAQGYGSHPLLPGLLTEIEQRAGTAHREEQQVISPAGTGAPQVLTTVEKQLIPTRNGPHQRLCSQEESRGAPPVISPVSTPENE